MTDDMKKCETTVAEMVHEVKNPLTTVKGLLQLLKPYLVMIEKEQYADLAISEINRADELLTAYANSNIAISPQQKLVCVNKLLEEMKLLFEREANVNRIQFYTHFDPDLPKVEVCRNELKQVLVNLVKNAVESLMEVKDNRVRKITLETNVQGKRIHVMVKDNGSGMDQATLAQLFTPFYTEKSYGTGLGLSICKKLIEKHDGLITVESQKNVGTTFQIALPSPADVD
ncbi:nitrogen regulation protein NR(II) [Robertmurraya sp.]|uniref:two-component system sensor histidine kinase NtrB n=1 Tax=Robertmurraya sp. TaxID=2837525 RepID=UPI0037037405